MNQDVALTTKGLSTRERIVQAARKKLILGGFDSLVMRELAQDLGIKLGNLQYYFKTKELLVLNVLQQEAEKDVQMIRALDAESAGVRLQVIVKELVSRWRGDSGVLFSILSALAIHQKPYKLLRQKIYLAFYDALATTLREVNPKLDDGEVKIRVRLITALIDGSPMQIRVGDLSEYLAEVQAFAESIARS